MTTSYTIAAKYFFLLVLIFSIQISFSQSEKKGNIAAEIIQKQQLGYVLHLPLLTKEKKPLIIFLHDLIFYLHFPGLSTAIQYQ